MIFVCWVTVDPGLTVCPAYRLFVPVGGAVFLFEWKGCLVDVLAVVVIVLVQGFVMGALAARGGRGNHG